MSTAKEEVGSLLNKLPDNCSLRDIQYHLCVLEKVWRGLEAAVSQGTVPQHKEGRLLNKWLME